eukprot:CAMPEP_0178675606 /NCGR_PEP_ID=MMETSP0698-20121128/35474_1 /TAXON_ID=265572 /ORGANISM="Extubocellulus spinifer, Strain CCMP396" /LENGTH=54 /DNA_ID=CAMNT_0020319793 /DNA_START=25 /DNA_END=185 /DNA_ORIENTATION=+
MAVECGEVFTTRHSTNSDSGLDWIQEARIGSTHVLQGTEHTINQKGPAVAVLPV